MATVPQCQPNRSPDAPQEGKVVSKGKVKDAWGMPEGAELELGQWELQVDAKMDQQQFRSA